MAGGDQTGQANGRVRFGWGTWTPVFRQTLFLFQAVSRTTKAPFGPPLWVRVKARSGPAKAPGQPQVSGRRNWREAPARRSPETVERPRPQGGQPNPRDTPTYRRRRPQRPQPARPPGAFTFPQVDPRPPRLGISENGDNNNNKWSVFEAILLGFLKELLGRYGPFFFARFGASHRTASVRRSSADR